MSFTTLCKRFLVLSLALAAFGLTSLQAQTVAYVTNCGDGTVSVINTLTNTLTTTILLGTDFCPAGVVFSPDSRHAYVANDGDGSVSVIDTATNTVVTTIPLIAPSSPARASGTPAFPGLRRASVSPRPPAGNSAPLFPAITPDGRRLYVPDAISNLIFMIDTANNNVSAFPLVSAAEIMAVAISPDGLRGYVLDIFGAVTVFDTATNTPVGDPIPTASSSFFLPMRFAMAPDGRVYVPGVFNGGVSVLTGAALTAVIPLENCPFSLGLVVSPDNARVYVACPFANGQPATVAVFDANNPPPASTATYIRVTPTETGGVLFNAAVTPDGAAVYVVDIQGNSVVVIDTATNTQTALVAVGNEPIDIAIANLSTPFAAFNVTNMVINGQNIHQQAQFTLGEGSTGIDLAHQPLTLTIGTFSITIPAGKFKQVGGNLHFIFNGTADGLKVNFNLQADKKSSTQFSYVVDIHGTNQTMQLNPAAVTLKIGENQGTTSAMWH
jgi:YVTN family beta-propeller protein